MLNVVVKRKSFLKALQIVENAVYENKIREVLSGVYIETGEGKLLFKGTDLELSINTEIDAEVEEHGKIVIKHKMIEEILKQINDEDITIKEEKGKVLIISKDADSEFSLYDTENYPIQPKLEIGLQYKFNREKFLSHIENVKFSATQEIENLSLNCIRIEIEDNKLKLISSDTYRLTYIEEELSEDQKNKEGLSLSIPLKTIEGLIKIMKVINEEEILFQSDGTRVLFKFSNTEILTRVIELQFPDYKSVLKNAQHDKKVLLNTKSFLSLLKRSFIIVKENKNTKNSGEFLFQTNKLILTGHNENGKIKEELQTVYEGETLRITLNVKFLIDFLYTLNGTIVEVQMKDSNSSVIIKEEGNDNHIYFTMPITQRG